MDLRKEGKELFAGFLSSIRIPRCLCLGGFFFNFILFKVCSARL